eukprot:4356417-Pleurochrysis_carterae.AAC.1
MCVQARRFPLRPHRPGHVGVAEEVGVAVGLSRRAHLPPRTRRRLECRRRRVAVANSDHRSRRRPPRCRRRFRHRPGAEELRRRHGEDRQPRAPRLQPPGLRFPLSARCRAAPQCARDVRRPPLGHQPYLARRVRREHVTADSVDAAR